MAQRLRPFGESDSSCSSYGNGYTLPLLIGHLEGLTSDEENTVKGSGLKQKRLEKVQDAVALLTEAMEMGKEDY